MRLEDFDFELPPELIAQVPVEPRDAARLLVLGTQPGQWQHHHFRDIQTFLKPGDVLVVNDAKVIPARLLGKKSLTGGKAELLLVRPTVATPAEVLLSGSPGAVTWVCLGQASKGLRAGQSIALDSGGTARVIAALGEGEYHVQLDAPPGTSLAELLATAGRLPLPPYITREPTEADAARYQTVYARARGSVAAPTAGLHFSDALWEAIREADIERLAVTLDVGPGTFLPVRDSDVSKHRMHGERYDVPPAVANAINTARSEGRRIIAVGTTVVRTLESATDSATGTLRSGPGESTLFIKPGFVFRQVDALVTNFHLPRSTLLMLVSAFAGQELMLAAYREAVAQRYRFFSYGDAMFIAP